MKTEDVKEAIREAERFIKKARKIHDVGWTDCSGKKQVYLKCGADAAACKRSSMDLTRALAKMRRA